MELYGKGSQISVENREHDAESQAAYWHIHHAAI